MRKKALIVVGIMIFILGQVGVNYLIYKDKFSMPIPKVKLKDQEEKKDTFAIMLEQSDGTYQATESTSFNQPGYTFNNEKSGCIDINGNKVDNALSYDETAKAVGVTSNKTIYCYVYFDLKPSDGANQLIESEELWPSGLEGDGYRYTGTDPDNYICFGTTNKDTCIGNTDAYMYRIIGVFPDSEENQHMKLIKKEALNKSRVWYDSPSSNKNWELSALFNDINGSTYLTSTTYMPTGWSDRITNWTWSAVNTLNNLDAANDRGPNYNGITIEQIYLHELNRSGKSNTKGSWTTPSGKIGLMYVSDYLMSLGSSILSYTPASKQPTLKTGWIHLQNNDTKAPNSLEWTMSRCGLNGNGYYDAWYVSSLGNLGNTNLHNTFSVRPVFYLNSDQVISSGSGTIGDPFILS